MALIKVDCVHCGGRGNQPRPGSDFPIFCDACSGTGKMMAEITIPEAPKAPQAPVYDPLAQLRVIGWKVIDVPAPSPEAVAACRWLMAQAGGPYTIEDWLNQYAAR